MTWAIGIDVGGTFTDLVAIDEAGAVTTAKSVSTPEDQSIGVMRGLALLAQAIGLPVTALLAQTSRVVHGTTVATNALLEGNGARVGLLITEGHRDVVEMREGLKPERYDLRLLPPPPLVPRHLRLPVRERLRADGSIAIPLDTELLEAALRVLVEDNVEAVAICFLHSWRNAVHEQRAAEAVRRALPSAYIAVSSEVLPEIREYERFSTTVATALVGPVVRTYLARLHERLRAAGLAGPLFVMLSHGGIATVEEAIRLAAGTALSGPAGGVAAGVALARQGAGADLVTFDMGGTSTDIALVRGGRSLLTSSRSVGPARMALPSLDIVTLGAGGGSIARIDSSGLLQVGPQSAGARPGPACYGAGGEAPTVTDANLLLGYVDPANFLGGRQALDRQAAEAAVAALGRQLGLDTIPMAAGIHRVINARMADGLRVATVRRGIDPRRFTLLAFGGAAGLHVAAIAATLGITRVLLPLQAAVLSAWGMLNTDLRIELMRSLAQDGIDIGALQAACAAMEREGRERLCWFAGETTVRRSADMRYGEQISEIPVPITDFNRVALTEAFHDAHEALFTYALRDREPVLVNARVTVAGSLAAPAALAVALQQPGQPGHRRIHLGGWQDVSVYEFETLAAGQEIAGPAIIESGTTTVLLRGGDAARFHGGGWLELAVALE